MDVVIEEIWNNINDIREEVNHLEKWTEKKLEELSTEFLYFEEDFKKACQRISDLFEKVGKLNEKLADLKEQIEVLDRRIERLEQLPHNRPKDALIF